MTLRAGRRCRRTAAGLGPPCSRDAVAAAAAAAGGGVADDDGAAAAEEEQRTATSTKGDVRLHRGATSVTESINTRQRCYSAFVRLLETFLPLVN
jgi:hypothetical protein